MCLSMSSFLGFGPRLRFFFGFWRLCRLCRLQVEFAVKVSLDLSLLKTPFEIRNAICWRHRGLRSLTTLADLAGFLAIAACIAAPSSSLTAAAASLAKCA
jgi:hypothetical protein